MSSTNLGHLKFAIMGGTFVRSADENYITARWCAQSGQHTDFAWLAVHALEKYMKAVLLANGRSAKSFSHNIPKLYEVLETFCGNLLPSNLGNGSTAAGHPLLATEYLKGIYATGNEHARYGIFGSSISLDDLSNLDTMIFTIRRLICPLDDEIDGIRLNPEDQVPTYREWLVSNPSQLIRIGGILRDIVNNQSHPLRKTTLNCNLALAPQGYQHDWSWCQSSWRESVIDRHVFKPLNSDDVEIAKQAIELAKWLKDKIRIPDGTRGIPGWKQIEDAVNVAKANHNID